jgi:hypothetical protein
MTNIQIAIVFILFNLTKLANTKNKQTNKKNTKKLNAAAIIEKTYPRNDQMQDKHERHADNGEHRVPAEICPIKILQHPEHKTEKIELLP